MTIGNPVDKTSSQWNLQKAEDGSKYDVKGGKIGAHSRHQPYDARDRLPNDGTTVLADDDMISINFS